MDIIVVKQFKAETNRISHYSYIDLGYRRMFLSFKESAVTVNAELLGISALAYLDLPDGSYKVISPGKYDKLDADK